MKLIAHRGANKCAPQNTLAAFKIAKEMNVDGFETDVHFTKDGKVVLCHNPSIDATSNGKGFINDLTYDELLSYDFGSYFGKDYAGEKIPELTEFLEIAQGLEIINIEIKTPYNKDYSIVDETIHRVKDANLFESLLISSFDPVVLRRAKDIDGNTKTALLHDFSKRFFEDRKKDPVDYAAELGCEALHALHVLTDRRVVHRAHKLGMKVNCWTVDTAFASKKLQHIGADGLITDVPDKLAAFGG